MEMLYIPPPLDFDPVTLNISTSIVWICGRVFAFIVIVERLPYFLFLQVLGYAICGVHVGSWVFHCRTYVET